MRFRRSILTTVIVLLILIAWAEAAQAQIVWAGRGSSRPWDTNPHDGCLLPDDMRYLEVDGITVGAPDAAYLIVGLNMATTDTLLLTLPYEMLIVGHPSGQSPPPGIPPYSSGVPCWNQGMPTFPVDPSMSAAVTTDPQNPIAGIGTWRVFVVPLSPPSLPAGVSTNVEVYYTLDHEGDALEVMNDVKGLVSGIITTNPPDTILEYQAPAFGPQVFTKMHFPQYPDSFGMDVNFTYPKVLADDWLCTSPDPVTDIRFWFSSQGDWFDPIFDLTEQISNIHVSIHANIPDSDGPGPDYSRPGALLWQRDFAPDEEGVAFRHYAESLQDWYDPNIGEFVPGDHLNTYECLITGIVSPFVQETDSIYWLDLSIATDDSLAPTNLLGWKTSNRAIYPAGYADMHFMDDAVWGDFPAPFWENFIYPDGPYVGESPDLSFVLDEEIVSVAVCHDSIWHDEEYCGFDANYVTGVAEMNHDCILNVIDLYLFADQYLEHGLALSADLNADGQVDLMDFTIFAGGFGLTAAPCNPYPIDSPLFEGSIALSFSTDPLNVVSTTSLPPGVYSVYVVIDGWSNATVVEYMVETSPNVTILNHVMSSALPASPITIPRDPDPQHTYRAFTVKGTTWPPGPVLFAQIDFWLTDANPASFEFSRVPWVPVARNRWSTEAADRGHVFIHRYGAGINGYTPTGIDAEAPKPYRIVSVSPNPFNPSTIVHFTLPSEQPVTAEIWSVSGQRVRVLASGKRFGVGDNRLEWDGRNDDGALVASGVYFVRLQTPLGVKVSRAVALK